MPDGRFEPLPGSLQAEPGPALQQVAPDLICLIRLRLLGSGDPAQQRPTADRAHQRVHHLPCDLLLHREHIGQIPVVCRRPDVGVGMGIDETHGDPDPVGGVPDRPLQNVADAQGLHDLPQREASALERASVEVREITLRSPTFAS
jgi:hypothetical protein